MTVVTHPNVPVQFNYAEHENGWADAQNRALANLAALTQCVVVSVGANTPPGSPGYYEPYVAGVSPTDAWEGHANQIAYATLDGWVFVQARVGWRVFSTAQMAPYLLTSAGWRRDVGRLTRRETASTSFALQDVDAFGMLVCTAGTAVTATLNAGVFRVLDEISVYQNGAGQISFTEGASVDITAPPEKSAATYGPGSVVSLYLDRIASGVEYWILIGDAALV